MGVNKVVVGDEVKLDLTSDTVTTDTLLAGVTAHDKSGLQITGTASGGIDYNAKPQITFDGKWSGWYIEFYGGVPYWEAQFFSSGTLSVSGSYVGDAHGIGGGGSAYNPSSSSGGDRGATAIQRNITLSGSLAITIGAGVGARAYSTGGTTSLGNLLSCTGGRSAAGSGTRPSASRGDVLRRFDDAGHAADAGSDGTSAAYSSGVGTGGMMHWRGMPQCGEGYGAGGGVAYPDNYQYYFLAGHSGVLIIRVLVK